MGDPTFSLGISWAACPKKLLDSESSHSKNHRIMTIAVDFDGTIVTHAYPAIGREMPGAIDTLCRLQRHGHRLILWSVREGQLLDEAVEYCRQRGLEFYAVNENYTGERAADAPALGCRKLNADIYIDDRNIGGFPGWEAIYQMLTHQISYARYCSELMNPSQFEKRKGFFSRLFN